MAAGQGYIEFATGDVLTAAAANGYLASQVVMVFASSAARTSSITSPQEGMLSYLKDTNAVEAYDGAAWISIGSTGDITGVTAGTGISGGGTSGTVTVTNSMATAITTAGDLIKGTGSGTFDRLGIGSTGQVLTVSGGAPSWATPAGGASFSGARAYASGTQNINTATSTVLTWNSESFDSNSYHSTSSNTGRLTVPATGYYIINGLCMFNVNGTGVRIIECKKNNTTSVAYIEEAATTLAATASSVQFSAVVYATASDYFEMIAYQNSGSTISTYVGGEQFNFFSIVSLGA
jgi:hypothetical protein